MTKRFAAYLCVAVGVLLSCDRAEVTALSARAEDAPARPPTSVVFAADQRETEKPPPSSSKPKRTPDVVFVPTPQPIVDKMLELAKPKKTDVVYDLGCGDGRIVVTAAKRYGVRAFGFDIDPRRVKEARENVRQNKLEHLVTIEQKDIFTLDLSPANVVTLYLLASLNVKLIPQLEKLRPGSRIVSHDFDMKGVKPQQVLTLKPPESDREHYVYFWQTPLQKEIATIVQP